MVAPDRREAVRPLERSPSPAVVVVVDMATPELLVPPGGVAAEAIARQVERQRVLVSIRRAQRGKLVISPALAIRDAVEVVRLRKVRPVPLQACRQLAVMEAPDTRQLSAVLQ